MSCPSSESYMYKYLYILVCHNNVPVLMRWAVGCHLQGHGVISELEEQICWSVITQYAYMYMYNHIVKR